MILKRSGQSVTDLALIIGIVGLMIVGMQVYVKRGLQGRVADATNFILSAGQAEAEDTADFRRSETTSDSSARYTEKKGGGRVLDEAEIITRTHYESGSSEGNW